MLSANSFAAQLLSNAKSPDDLRDALMASPERHPEMPVKFWLDIHTQHMTVDEKAHDAFAEVARVAGYAPAEHRSYVD